MARFLFYDDKIINIMMQEEKPSGGAAVQAYGWIRGLSEAGQDVHLLTNTSGRESLKEECKDIRLHALYDRNKGVRWIRWIYYRLPHVYKTIKKVKPDFLYQGIPGWQSSLLGLVCRWLDIKYILRISNDFLLDDRFYKNNSKAHRYFQRLGIKLSHCILCQNEYQYGIIRKEYPDKMAMKISNPIFLKENDHAVDIQDRKYIAWLGLYQYQKNLPLLYEIACKLSHEQFLVAGKEGTNCDQESRDYLEKLKKLTNVKFVGFLQREQVMPFLANARFLLNTSHYEGFSNTFLEAMSVGTPIMTSHKVNPDSIITNHELGIVYKDADDLQSQFVALSEDSYATMSHNVAEYVVQQHDYRILAKRLLSFLQIKETTAKAASFQTV